MRTNTLTSIAIAGTLLLALGCRTASAGAEPDAPNDLEQPEEKPPEEQHFCCKSTSTSQDAKVGYGDGCTFAEKIHVGTCSAVLYCPGGYTLDNGAVTCPL